MANNLIPYLCGGTFLTQLLRARKPLATPTEHIKRQKESLSEQETFRRLISIYQMRDFLDCSSLKTYTSQFKTCTNSLEAFAQFSDSDMKREFDDDVRGTNSAALDMMSDLVEEFIDSSKFDQLIRCLLGIIKSDCTIAPSTQFYVLGGDNFVTKEQLVEMSSFVVEPFLLGIWHFIIMNRSDKNEMGASTYKQWYSGRGNYVGTVSDCISQDISIRSVPFSRETENADAEEPLTGHSTSADEKQNTQTVNQYINHATIVQQYGEKSVHIEHLDTLNL